MENDNKQQQKEYNDAFSRLMFGPFPPQQTGIAPQKGERKTEGGQEIDFIQLMQSIDTLVSSFDKLKPLMKKFSPFIDLFKK